MTMNMVLVERFYTVRVYASQNTMFTKFLANFKQKFDQHCHPEVFLFLGMTKYLISISKSNCSIA